LIQAQRDLVELRLRKGRQVSASRGVWAAVVSGAPVGDSVRILGERMPPPDQSYWKRVLVRCNPQVISRSERVGRVGVDYARLLIADFDVLGAWQHEDSLDGLSDFVF